MDVNHLRTGYHGSAMKNDSPLAVIARRKWIVIGVLLAFVVTTAVASKTLEKIYVTHSTLLVALPADTASFDSVQASQAIARSYADIIESPNVAQLVADRLPDSPDRDNILAKTTFEPVEQTQLLQIGVEDPSAGRAKQIADTWADVATEYARTRLEPTTGATLTVADRAPRPSSPDRPKPTLYTLVAAIIGLALGLGAAFLRDRLDRRLRTADDVEERFDAPVLARIARRGRSAQSVTAFREAFRILRTNLQFTSHGRRLRSIAVTSGQGGEGKTTTVAQLAMACAEVGQRVIVIEADFRRPALQHELIPDGDEPLRPGLSNYLVEAAELEEVVFPTGLPNVDIVPSGPLPPSPSALLESRRGRTLVQELCNGEADVVLIDCPPLTIGADASVIAGWVDGVVVIVDLHSSTHDSVREALRQLDAVHATTLGLVLNRDRGAEPTSYDYYNAPISTEAEMADRSPARSLR
jgi:polysaccharide biosynthesis transport protein